MGLIRSILAERGKARGIRSVDTHLMSCSWTGREFHADKHGVVPHHLAPIMERLARNRSNCVETVRGFGRLFKQAAGRSSSLIDAEVRRSRRLTARNQHNFLA
jgi:hypothetical protein